MIFHDFSNLERLGTFSCKGLSMKRRTFAVCRSISWRHFDKSRQTRQRDTSDVLSVPSDVASD